MSWNLTIARRFDDEEGRIQSETKPAPEDAPTTESYRNPVRMYAVAMNMRRLAHSRRASLSAQVR